jgi:hypothetical protein
MSTSEDWGTKAAEVAETLQKQREVPAEVNERVESLLAEDNPCSALRLILDNQR